MKRKFLIGVATMQIGVMFAVVFWDARLFVPAAIGLVLIAASIPEETR